VYLLVRETSLMTSLIDDGSLSATGRASLRLEPGRDDPEGAYRPSVEVHRCADADATSVSGLKLLVYEALRSSATSVCGLKCTAAQTLTRLVYEALSY
jgi:hypothetical protein